MLVGLCLLVSWVGWFGQQRLLENFETFETAETLSAQVSAIDRQIPVLKGATEKFLLTGATSQLMLAESLLDDVGKELQAIELGARDDELANLLSEIGVRLETFSTQLKTAVEERKVRTRLVDDTIPELTSQIQSLFREATEETGEQTLSWREASRAFASARASLLKYLSSPDYADIEDMLEELRQASDSLRQIDTADETVAASNDSPNDANEALQAIAEFERAAMRAFQATRGYLFYSNVVLAGEISEIVYYSDRIKMAVSERQQATATERAKADSKTRFTIAATSVAAISLAIALATGLSLIIVRPIAQLTETFRELSTGATLKSIPGVGRPDEIGRMARAAAIFGRRNQETRELLAESSRLSDELEEKASALEETNKELDNFAYVASHDLKAPLRGIRNLAEWIEEDLGDSISPDVGANLKSLIGRVDRMNLLLDDLLQYSRVGRVGQEPELVDCGELIRSILKVVDGLRDVDFVVDDNLPILVTARAPLQQVFLNLITNAVKYLRADVTGRIEISCSEEGAFYLFRVRDNGIGIEEKHFDRIFQMYQRCAPDLADGSGMGLAIVKKHIETFGGSISIDSKVDHGSTFVFSWPKQASIVEDQPAKVETTAV